MFLGNFTGFRAGSGGGSRGKERPTLVTGATKALEFPRQLALYGIDWQRPSRTFGKLQNQCRNKSIVTRQRKNLSFGCTEARTSSSPTPTVSGQSFTDRTDLYRHHYSPSHLISLCNVVSFFFCAQLSSRSPENQDTIRAACSPDESYS